jgi:hypothetical protein
MNIFNNLSPLVARVFPTFNQDKWIDLKDKNGNVDGIKQENEVIEIDVHSEVVDTNDTAIIRFIRENIEKIPDDKVEQFAKVLFDCIQKNPVGEPYYDGESSFSAEEALAIIISYEPKYLMYADRLLSNDNFLVRWAAVGVFGSLDVQDNSIQEKIKNDLITLQQREHNKKIIDIEDINIKTTYYQVNELYAEYLDSLKYVINQYNK